MLTTRALIGGAAAAALLAGCSAAPGPADSPVQLLERIALFAEPGQSVVLSPVVANESSHPIEVARVLFTVVGNSTVEFLGYSQCLRGCVASGYVDQDDNEARARDVDARLPFELPPTADLTQELRFVVVVHIPDDLDGASCERITAMTLVGPDGREIPTGASGSPLLAVTVDAEDRVDPLTGQRDHVAPCELTDPPAPR